MIPQEKLLETSEPLRPGFILSGPNELSGVNVWVVRLVCELNSLGVEAFVIYLNHDRTVGCRNLLLAGNINNIISVEVHNSIEINALEISKACLNNKLTHIIPNYSIAAYLAGLILRNNGTRMIPVVHSDDNFYYDLLRYLAKCSSKIEKFNIVVVSRYLAGRTRYILPGSNVSVIPCGVPKYHKDSEKPVTTFNLMYAGRIIREQKRIDRIFEFMYEATRRFDSIVCTICGDGPDLKLLKSWVKNRCPLIRVKEGLSNNAVLAEMKRSHALIMLSDYEGLPVTLLEGMAQGCIPIVSDIKSGIPDVILNGRNGFVIPSEHFDDGLQILDKLISSRAYATAISKSARNTITKKGLDIGTTAQLWLAVLSSCGSDDASAVDLENNEEKSLLQAIMELPTFESANSMVRTEDLRHVLRTIRDQYLNRRPLLLWGASNLGKRLLTECNQIHVTIDGFVDSDRNKHGSEFCGLPVINPDDLFRFRDGQRPFIAIASSYYEVIKLQLTTLGLTENDDFL